MFQQCLLYCYWGLVPDTNFCGDTNEEITITPIGREQTCLISCLGKKDNVFLFPRGQSTCLMPKDNHLLSEEGRRLRKDVGLKNVFSSGTAFTLQRLL